MNLTTIGDLAQTFSQRRQNVQLQQEMNRLIQELSSGRAADLTRHLGGGFAFLSEIERDLQVSDSYRLAADEARLSTSIMQTSLERVHDLAGNLSNTALVIGTTTGVANLPAVAAEGLGGLDAMIAVINTNVAGRSLFAGTEVSSTPLISADDLLTEVRTALAGASSVADVTTALDTFFDTPGGGFETTAYQGGLEHLAPFQLGEGESVGLDLRADDPAFRSVLKNTVMAAILNDASLAITIGDRHELSRISGEGLLGDLDRITGIRADLGFAEERIDKSIARITAGVFSLEIAKGDLIEINPYDTATELENVQFQLEALYTLTARTSRLSLLNFLP